jgi:formamidopyrimidine-DNA glycosylase
LIELDNSLAIVIHLGMSGKVLISKSNIPDRKHDHARIGLMGNDEIELVYNDPRRFGLISILNMSELSTHRLFKNLGIEPLTDQFDGAYMMKTCRNHHGPIKNIIMKNEILVGVGNIYASESLFLSGINPLKPANKLSIDEYTQLSLAIKQVLVAAINSGGSTLRDYNQLNGESGYFQHMFQVYGRYNKPCYVCATPIEQIKLAGRTSFYCPKCQSMEC